MKLLEYKLIHFKTFVGVLKYNKNDYIFYYVRPYNGGNGRIIRFINKNTVKQKKIEIGKLQKGNIDILNFAFGTKKIKIPK